MIWYVRWRDPTNEDGNYLHGRWRGEWERDGSLRVYELDAKAVHPVTRERMSRATRSLWEDIIQVRAVVGVRGRMGWVPFMDALDRVTEVAA